MRLPHEQYIRFLITTGLAIDEANDNLLDIGLCHTPEDYWQKQEDILYKAKLPKAVTDFWGSDKKKVPKDYLSYMNVVGLKEAWLWNAGQSKSFVLAMDILKDPDVSRTTRGLISISTPSDEMAALLHGRYAMNVSRASLDVYRAYFFNPLIMSRESWRLHLETLGALDKKILYLGLTGNSIELRAELGLPNRISVSEHYQRLHIFAMSKFETYRNSSDPQADSHALKWASLAMASGDKYEKLKLGDASDFGKDLQMEFDFVDTEFPMIGQDNLEEIQKESEKKPKTEGSAPIPLENFDD